MTHCLVTGATGYIGSRLVARLARAGFEVMATARNPAKLEAFDFPSEVQRVELDVADAQSCADAFDQAGPVDVAYFLVHSVGEGAFAEHDLESARQFAKAAHDAGVGRIVYLGGFVPARRSCPSTWRAGPRWVTRWVRPASIWSGCGRRSSWAPVRRRTS